MGGFLGFSPEDAVRENPVPKADESHDDLMGLFTDDGGSDDLMGLFTDTPEEPEQIEGLEGFEEPEEMTVDKFLDLMAEPSGEKSDRAAGLLGQDEIDVFEGSLSGGGAFLDYWEDNHGIVSKLFYTLTVPEQLVAREATNLLENLDLMSTEQAKDLLSKDQLHGSDLVNFYWDNPNSTIEKSLRFATGLAADIIMDPLSYIGIGALTQAGKTAVIGGKTFKNLGKMSKYERNFYRTMEQADVIIQSNSRVRGKQKMQAAVDKNREKLYEAIEDFSKLSAEKGAPEAGQITLDNLKQSLNIKKAGQAELQGLKVEGKSLGQQLVDGERGITLGFNIPFTNVAKEIEMPFTRGLSEMSGNMLLNLSNIDPMGGAIAMMDRVPLGRNTLGDVGRTMGQEFKRLWTKTGHDGFDDSMNLYYGGKELTDQNLNKWENQWREIFSPSKWGLTKQEMEKLMPLVTDEIEWGLTHGDIEAELLARGIEEVISFPELTEKAKSYGDRISRARNKWAKKDAADKASGVVPIATKAKEEADEIFNERFQYSLDQVRKIKNQEDKVFDKRGYQRPSTNSFFFDDSLSRATDNFTREFTPVIIKPATKERALLADPRRAERWDKIDFITKGNKELQDNIQKMISEIRSQNIEAVKKYTDRGVPFDQLNPFNKDWVNSYAKHKFSKDWLKFNNKVGKEADDGAFEFLSNAGQKFDKSAEGRRYRGSILDANDASLAEHNVKIFVDDPIQLHVERMREMDAIARNYDMMKAAIPYTVKSSKRPNNWYVRYKPEDFEDLILHKELKIKGAGKGIKAVDAEMVTKQFVPDYYYKGNIPAGQDIWIPAGIYDRFHHNLRKTELAGVPALIAKTGTMFNHVFRNNALFGPGYLGMNMFSNLTTYALAGVTNPTRSLAKATALLSRKHGSKLVLEGLDGVPGGKLNSQELWDMMAQYNVIGSGIEKELKFIDVAENIGGASKLFKHDVKTVADIAFGWRLNRNIAQWGDNIPKMAVFIDRLESGFSPAAAAEAAEKYYYNYNNISSRMAKIRTAIPFSTFPVKTAEMVYDELKTGKWAKLTIPGKVSAALQGQYVEDHETRQALREFLPKYYQHGFDRIHGPLLPGQREVLLEFPWAKAALGFFVDPTQNMHPLIQVLAMKATSRASDEELEASAGIGNQVYELGGRLVDSMIPPLFAKAFAVYELNNGEKAFNGWFSRRYLPDIPTDSDYANTSNTSLRFENAAEFGAYLEKNHGSDLMYRMVFPDKVDTESDSTEIRATIAGRGEFVRRHFRNLTLGLSSMTALDRNFFTNKFALQRAIDKQKRGLWEDLTQKRGLPDADIIENPKRRDELLDLAPAAKELISLEIKQKALDDYYEFVISEEMKDPDGGLFEKIFGMDEYQFDMYDSTEKKRAYHELNRDRSKDLIQEIDAVERLEDIIDEEEDSSPPELEIPE